MDWTIVHPIFLFAAVAAWTIRFVGRMLLAAVAARTTRWVRRTFAAVAAWTPMAWAAMAWASVGRISAAFAA